MTCKLQGFLFGKLARFSFPSQRHMRLSNMRPVFSKTFSLEFIQRHCQILMLRINLGLTWPFTLVARLLGIADLDSFHIESTPPVWINTVLFLILFLMCCKFSRTSTSPPDPTQPKKLRSMRMCCKFSRTSTSPPHPTQPKKLRSMRMCCKFSRTSTSPPHPTQPKKLRSMRMCCKFSRTSTSPPHPTQPKKLRFTKTRKTLARFSPRWRSHVG